MNLLSRKTQSLLCLSAAMMAGRPADANSPPPTKSLPVTPILPTPEQIALDAAKSVWDFESTGFYDFQYTKHTMTPFDEGYPWTVKVRDGMVEEVLLGNGTALSLNPDNYPPTISDLFKTIQDAIFRGADAIQVTYDDADG